MFLFSQIIKHEIILAFTSKQEVLHSATFFILSIVIFHFSLAEVTPSLSLAFGFSAILLLLSLTLVNRSLLDHDYVNDMFTQYIFTNTAIEVILIAKWVAYAVTTVLPMLVIIPLGVYMLCQEFITLYMLLVLLIFSLNSSLILLCSNALLLGSKKYTAFSVTTLPFHIPNIIISLMAFSDISNMLLLFSLFLFYLPVCIAVAGLVANMVVLLS